LTILTKIGATAALISCALPVPSRAAEASGPEAVPVHRCQFSQRVPEGGQANLEIFKSFGTDGAVNSMQVHWEDNQAGAVRLLNPDDRAFVSLQWPGEHRIGRYEEEFDWSRGSITVTLLVADAAANFRLLPGEEWRQMVVDRNGSVLVHERKGMRTLFLSGLDLRLVSDLEPPTSPGRLSMSLDSLLAWGTGVERLTVYETRVTRRKKVPNTYPTSPAGRIRVVGSYEVDVAALALAFAQVRAATEAWEAGLASSWRQCEQTIEGGDILVTEARVPGAKGTLARAAAGKAR
jgi:hypothetical protein